MGSETTQTQGTHESTDSGTDESTVWLWALRQLKHRAYTKAHTVGQTKAEFGYGL